MAAATLLERQADAIAIRQALLTEAQAAEFLGIKSQTLSVWRCTRRYSIPFVKVGAAVRYKLSDLQTWIDSRTVTPAAAV